MGYLVQAAAYVSGVLLIGGGLYLILRGSLPGWWQRRLMWPLVRVTPTVAHLQGWAAVGVGASILAIVLTSVAPEGVSGLLVWLAMVAYLAGLLLFLFSTWLSRRPAS